MRSDNFEPGLREKITELGIRESPDFSIYHATIVLVRVPVTTTISSEFNTVRFTSYGRGGRGRNCAKQNRVFDIHRQRVSRRFHHKPGIYIIFPKICLCTSRTNSMRLFSSSSTFCFSNNASTTGSLLKPSLPDPPVMNVCSL